MGKYSAYRAVEGALLEAIYSDNEAPELSPLNTLEDAELICSEARVQAKYLRNLTNSLETNINFHRGRALLLRRRTIDQSLLTPYETRIATRTYSLFKGFEVLIGNYFGKPIEISKLTDQEIRQLRSLLHDPVNDELNNILDFRFEDESISDEDLDVSPNSPTQRFTLN
jgi:hypothetical protein